MQFDGRQRGLQKLPFAGFGFSAKVQRLQSLLFGNRSALAINPHVFQLWLTKLI
jgi:hypothetical protein